MAGAKRSEAVEAEQGVPGRSWARSAGEGEEEEVEEEEEEEEEEVEEGEEEEGYRFAKISEPVTSSKNNLLIIKILKFTKVAGSPKKSNL